MGRRRRRVFEAAFDGTVLRTVAAANVWEAIQRTGLDYCVGRIDSDRRRCPGHAPHGHIPAARFNPVPVRCGDRDVFVANLPVLGEVSYNFDAAHRVAPPVTFREVTDADA